MVWFISNEHVKCAAKKRRYTLMTAQGEWLVTALCGRQTVEGKKRHGESCTLITQL